MLMMNNMIDIVCSLFFFLIYGVIVWVNEIPKLFKNAILGKYRDEKRWISRDEFHI